MKKQIQVWAVISFVALILFSCIPGSFAQDFEVYLAISHRGAMINFKGETLTLKQEPFIFHVILKNIGESSRKVYEQTGPSNLSPISFELTDEEGNTFVMREKTMTTFANSGMSSFVISGQAKTITVQVQSPQWENVPRVEQGEVKKYKARVIYEMEGSRSVSREYEFIVDGSN